MFFTRIQRIKKAESVVFSCKNSLNISQCFVDTFVFQRNVIFFVYPGLDFILRTLL